MNWENWVVDCTLATPAGLFCFCPIEGDPEGEYNIVTGLNFISDHPGPGRKVVAVVHEDGQDAVEAWMAEHGAELEAALARPAHD